MSHVICPAMFEGVASNHAVMLLKLAVNIVLGWHSLVTVSHSQTRRLFLTARVTIDLNFTKVMLGPRGMYHTTHWISYMLLATNACYGMFAGFS